MAEKISLVVGIDQGEAVAYRTFCQSDIERSSLPVQFVGRLEGRAAPQPRGHGRLRLRGAGLRL